MSCRSDAYQNQITHCLQLIRLQILSMMHAQKQRFPTCSLVPSNNDNFPKSCSLNGANQPKPRQIAFLSFHLRSPALRQGSPRKSRVLRFVWPTDPRERVATLTCLVASGAKSNILVPSFQAFIPAPARRLQPFCTHMVHFQFFGSSGLKVASTPSRLPAGFSRRARPFLPQHLCCRRSRRSAGSRKATPQYLTASAKSAGTQACEKKSATTPAFRSLQVSHGKDQMAKS